ncbi:malto-oligosyltrehalose synthase [Sphingobium sp.]|uniref:malto-oligosyltrehalose synthase n=1 Tax=Sphingobium sp. TaxID=1912891 RepID=UPI002CF07728|nr:malto-oligosyltrehalose synthase [Sphingobium sp.]HUD95849.1 malto-oligosyltrehalose synthase [Sphingobium sp.]
MIPRATYRLQLTRDFPFAAAERIVPYLARLGVSHIYASPITTARSGSTHSYDVIDPTRINPELGGDSGFRSLVSALRAHDMGVIIDIVPNHMGVAGGENLWWNDVLRLGRDSAYAGFFDIDWRGPLILPILGATLDDVIAAGDLSLVTEGADAHLLLYGEQHLPLRPGSLDQLSDGPDRVLRLLETQHYRLVHWRAANDRLNWRRFFSINDLAGLRVEDPAVFETTHQLYFDLFRDGLIDGVRIDHVDGLTDPAGYCRRLRSRLDAIRGGDERAYIIVEKILAPGEDLANDWGVDGTSGYDFMRDVTALLHDPRGEAPLDRLWRERDPDHADVDRTLLDSRRDMLSWQFEAQLCTCVEAFVMLADDAGLDEITPAMIRRAIERLLWVFPVYRTYGDGRSAPAGDAGVRQKTWDAVQPHLPPGETPVARRIVDWLAGDGPGDAALAAEAVRRFQQLSAPIAAKGLEDTAFYRRAPLLSANDVGSAPQQFAISPAELHRRVQTRSAPFPHAMLATATHDHKRGEDMRARLSVLSHVPSLWQQAVGRWENMAASIAAPLHPADRYQLFQTLLGTWPIEAALPQDFSDRIDAWLMKSLREGRLRSSWEAPNEPYEAQARHYLKSLLALPAFRDDMSALMARLLPAAQANSLAQIALKFCLPGVPDLYQGTEGHDFSLVDPDNRRRVDHLRLAAMLDQPLGLEGEKLSLIHRLLNERRVRPALFLSGEYHPVAVSGPRASHIFAFERRCGQDRLLCAAMIRSGRAIIDHGGLPTAQWWQETRLDYDIAWAADDLFAHSPIFLNLCES